MKSRLKFTVALLGLIAVLAAWSGVVDAAKPARPFKGKGEAQLLGDPLVGTDFVTSGTATHLGAFTGNGFVTFSPPDADGIIDGEGTLTFIAANGDELHTTFSGTLDASSGQGTATFIFDGGTGRFSQATGQFEAAIVQEGPASFSFTLSGTLSY